MDKRLGKAGGVEPSVCAVTGQPVRGRHSTHYHLPPDGYYFSILEKAAMRMNKEEIEEVRKECRALIPRSQPKPKLKRATTKPDSAALKTDNEQEE